jgi:hypothetical protein
VISFIAAAAVVGCGKSSVPAEDTTSAKKTEPKEKGSDADKSAADDSNADSGSAKGDAKAKSNKPSDDSLTVVRKAKDYITAPDVVFMYSFNESDAKGKAEKACSEKTKGNHEKQAACMTAAQKKFGADGYHFEKVSEDKWYWETVKIKNGHITNLHRVPIEFTKEEEKSIVVKVVGKDEAKGAKGYVPGEVTFDVPNAYQIVQTDPDDGKVVFEAKLGLLGDPATKKKH